MLYNDTVIQDGFAEKGPLQQWVGLHNELFPSKRESKARKALHPRIQDAKTQSKLLEEKLVNLEAGHAPHTVDHEPPGSWSPPGSPGAHQTLINVYNH